MYCGTRIILETPRQVGDVGEMTRLDELCRMALEAQNYEDALKYANRQLEIDPANVEAWLNKARATIQRNVGNKEWFNEGMEYLNHAEQISLGNQRIKDVRISLQRLRADRYSGMSRAFVHGFGQNHVLDSSRSVVDAGILKTVLGFMQDMLMATDLFPDDVEYLEVLAAVANIIPTWDWAKWNKNVPIRLNLYQRLIDRKEANERLPQLISELKTAQDNLANLRARGGILNSGRTWAADSQVKRLKTEITRLRAFF
jgi:tetratricopeptide (TPR) repeat protein